MSHFPRLAINLGRSNSRVIHSEPSLASSARRVLPPRDRHCARSAIPLQKCTTALKPWFRTAGADDSSAPARYLLALATVLVAVIVHIFLTPGLRRRARLSHLLRERAFFVAMACRPDARALRHHPDELLAGFCGRVFRWRGARIRSPVAVGHVGPKRNRDDRGRRSAPGTPSVGRLCSTGMAGACARSARCWPLSPWWQTRRSACLPLRAPPLERRLVRFSGWTR